ncbi:hypothetical protein [Paractinoplanes maris]|uniref:hypothetical protein n=1 Tax=Paractinoplanes maris TaxID=1734446 RepID=UPI0020208AFA|nr:hypothetical protein [Actinoplanes maris]
MTSAAPAKAPSVVSVAVWFQVALVGLLLLVIGVSIADAVHYDGLIDQAARGAGVDPSEVASERDTNLGWTLISGLPALVLVLWLGLTVVWLRRGSNVARILTWVGLGAPVVLSLLGCLFGGLVGAFGLLAFGLIDEGPIDGEPVDGEEYAFEDFSSYADGGFYDRLYDLDSGGLSLAFDAVTAFALTAAVLLAIATGVLLVTGPADRWFRPGRLPPRPQPDRWFRPGRQLPPGPQPFPYAGVWPAYPAGGPPSFHPPHPPIAAPPPHFPPPYPPVAAPPHFPPSYPPPSAAPQYPPPSAHQPPWLPPGYPPVEPPPGPGDHQPPSQS